MVTIYGIKNCNTVQKARDWLDARGVAYQFVDYKKTPASAAQLAKWCDEFGWERVLNRAGTSFRAVPEADKLNLDQGKAIGLMLAQNSMIKRPMLDLGGQRVLGFSEESYQAALG